MMKSFYLDLTPTHAKLELSFFLCFFGRGGGVLLLPYFSIQAITSVLLLAWEKRQPFTGKSMFVFEGHD